jgi:hypothetical protein
VPQSPDHESPEPEDWDDESIPPGREPAAHELDLASLVGRTIGDGNQYEIIERIGTGGFGGVFRARQWSTGQAVAVKLPRSDGEASRRIRRGGKLLGKLEHPCIATLIDAGRTSLDGVTIDFVVMHIVDGARWISDYCRDERLDVARRLELFAKVCEAVAHAHAKKVVHRDLKPPNILVNSSGEPKVIDFDIASVLDQSLVETMTQSAALTAACAGTLEYMSPEQLGRKKLDVRSDVFTLGVILWELAAGRRSGTLPGYAIREGKQPEEWLAEIGRDVAHPVPEGIAGIVLHCVQKDPDARYGNAGEIATALRHCLTTRGWVDPWWRTVIWCVTRAARQTPARFEALRSRLDRRAVFGAAVAVAAAALAWLPISAALDSRAKSHAYAMAVTTAAAGLSTSAGASLVDAVATRWMDWRGAQSPPLEVACLRGLLRGANPPRLGDGVAELAPAGPWLATGAKSGRITVAEAAMPNAPRYRPPGLTGDVATLVFDHSGTLLAAADTDGRWVVWNLNDIEQDSTPMLRAKAAEGGRKALAFSGDGTRLAVAAASGDVEVWDVSTAARLCGVSTGEAPDDTAPPSVCFNRDSTELFVAARDGAIHVFDPRTGKSRAPIAAFASGRVRLCRSSFGTRLASIDSVGRLRLHDAASGRASATPSTPAGVIAAGFSPAGDRLLAARRAGDGPAATHVLDVFDTTSTAQRLVASMPASGPIDEMSVGNAARLAVHADDGWRLWSTNPPPRAAASSLAAGGSAAEPKSLTPAIDRSQP